MSRFLARISSAIFAAIICVNLIAAPVFAVPPTNAPTEESQQEDEAVPEDDNETEAPTEEDTSNDNAAEDADDADDSAANTTGQSCFEKSGAIGWLICPGASFLSGVIDGSYWLLERLVVVDPISPDSKSPVHLVWNYLRNLSNIIFILLFIVVIYSQITGLGIKNYGIKRTLPRIIIAAILVNLSFIICTIVVDLSNIVGLSLRSLFMDITNMAVTNGHISKYAQGVNFAALTASILGLGTGASIIGLSVVGGFSGLFWLLLPILVSGVIAILAAVLTMAARQALIVILTMISPLAFACYLLPNTEKWFAQWRKIFTSMLIFFPMFSVLYGGAYLAGTVMVTSATDSLGVLLGMAVIILPLLMTFSLLRMSGSIPGMVGDKFRKLTSTPQDAIRRSSDLHRAIAKQKKLASQNPRLPSTHLAQYMKQRELINQGRAKDLENINNAEYAARTLQKRYTRRDGTISKEGIEYVNLQDRQRRADNYIQNFNNDYDRGIDANDKRVRAKDRVKLQAYNDSLDLSLREARIINSASAQISVETARASAIKIKEQLNAVGTNDTKDALGRAFNFDPYLSYRDDDHSAIANAYRETSGKALNAAISDAIATKRKADADTRSRYMELFNDAPPGPEIRRQLEHSISQSKDYSVMEAAILVMAQRGDDKELMQVFQEHSAEIADNPEMQKHLGDTLITLKKEVAPLWAWSKSNMIRRGMHNSGVYEDGTTKLVDEFVDYKTFLETTVDSLPDNLKKTAIDAIIPGITDSGICKTQDRTTYAYLDEVHQSGILKSLGFSIKQLRSAACSGALDGDALKALNSLITAGGENSAYNATNADKTLKNLTSFVQDMSASQFASIKGSTLEAINSFFIAQAQDPSDIDTVSINGKDVQVSTKLRDLLQEQIDSLNKPEAINLRNGMNIKNRRMFGVSTN